LATKIQKNLQSLYDFAEKVKRIFRKTSWTVSTRLSAKRQKSSANKAAEGWRLTLMQIESNAFEERKALGKETNSCPSNNSFKTISINVQYRRG
jgi:hypothetical protein